MRWIDKAPLLALLWPSSGPPLALSAADSNGPWNRSAEQQHSLPFCLVDENVSMPGLPLCLTRQAAIPSIRPPCAGISAWWLRS
ncbi:hypothetical protein Trco_005963 [Trichoderma cornu-damae]|uniref:Secreted protein n=1 Tax=Trichoderma cornu-damae TaxID=654480 RepID=A0A9P8QNW8_9HYPO|nr:hypothetical protein Trco_005963 [Trichoderma cornu-damae]